MNQYQPQPHMKPALLGSLTVALILSIASACDQPNQQATNRAAQNLSSTQTPTTNPPDATSTAQVIATFNAAATFGSYKNTVIAEEDNHLNDLRTQLAATQTQLAMTPSNTPNPLTTTATPISLTPTPEQPEPTPTLQLGIVECVPSTTGFPYVQYSCWRGIVNGQIVDVSSGRERIDFAGEDPTQGVVLVWTADGYYQTYRTPTKVGGIKIVSAEGTQLNLTSYGQDMTPTTITFDVATRQFETQSGTPIPTTPVPTAAP